MPDEDDTRPPGARSFVTIRPDGLDYIVAIEPVLPTGEGKPRTFGSKHDAFFAARVLWTDHRLPVRDFTDGHVGPRSDEK